MVLVVHKFPHPSGGRLAVTRGQALGLLKRLISGAYVGNYFQIWLIYFKTFQKNPSKLKYPYKIFTDNFYKISR